MAKNTASKDSSMDTTSAQKKEDSKETEKKGETPLKLGGADIKMAGISAVYKALTYEGELYNRVAAKFGEDFEEFIKPNIAKLAEVMKREGVTGAALLRLTEDDFANDKRYFHERKEPLQATLVQELLDILHPQQGEGSGERKSSGSKRKAEARQMNDERAAKRQKVQDFFNSKDVNMKPEQSKQVSEAEVEEDSDFEAKEPPRFETLPVGWLLSNAPSTIMVRDCHKPLLGKVLHELGQTNVLITGSGGTGKTQFQALIAKQLVQERVSVVLDLEDNCFVHIDKDREVHFGQRGDSFNDILDSRNTVYLFDARDNAPTPLDVQAATCVTASPSRGTGLKQWLRKGNNPAVVTLYMPPWTLPELLVAKRGIPEYKVIEEEAVLELFDRYGGSVRNTIVKLLPAKESAIIGIGERFAPSEVKKSKLQIQKEALDGDISACDSKLLLQYLKGQNALGDKADLLNHTLLKIVPSDDFYSFSFSFASDYIRDQVFKKDSGRIVDEFKQLLANNTDAVLAGVRGQAYESHVNREFKKLSGEHKAPRLLPDKSVQDFTLNFPELKAQVNFDKLSEVSTQQYGIPKSRNYAAVDAVLLPNIALQMTVSANHGFNVDGLKAIKTGLKLDENDILHVVLVSPPDVVDQITCQPLTRGKKRVANPKGLVDGKGLMQHRLSFAWE